MLLKDVFWGPCQPPICKMGSPSHRASLFWNWPSSLCAMWCFPTMAILSLLFIAVTWGTKGLFGLDVQSWSIIAGSQGRDSRSRGKNHGGMMLTGLLPLVHSSTFFRQPRTTCLRMAPPAVGWALLHPSNQETATQTCQQANLKKVFFSQLRFPFPR